ncbi:Hypothetical predicted protein [Marmota monax]|uniref:Uncharacterized protein n=1 Tax=Marmota monax TaxID=9995 RepID=A0A5E4CZM9_MARMO|nr:hypothetical protein GHT09_018766 [Marmota monax]VTJ86710.1 Hypothetical predicted protein [Marmota monax]
MERSTVRGSLHKHLDLERKIAKQAEARLRQQLQSLEDICLYHLKLLTREQRQLQREQQRLQQAVRGPGPRTARASYPGQGFHIPLPSLVPQLY